MAESPKFPRLKGNRGRGQTDETFDNIFPLVYTFSQFIWCFI